jgi:hypothetical protein
MDFITLAGFVLFALQIVGWVALPGGDKTGVEGTGETSAVGLGQKA